MANSYVEIPVSGASTYTFPFPYIAEADVKVYVGGVLQTISTNYTFTSSNIIEFTAGNTPVDTNQVVRIQRETESENKLVTYSNTGLDANDLNLGSNQNFYLAQEATDKAKEAVSVGSNGLLDVSGRLVNLDEPVDNSDAATKGYVASQVAGGNGSVTSSSTAPTGASQGDLWIDTDNNIMYVWTGAEWVNGGVQDVERHDIAGSSVITLDGRGVIPQSEHNSGLSSITALYLNGVLLKPTTVINDFTTGDYDLLDTQWITLASTVASDDVVTVIKSASMSASLIADINTVKASIPALSTIESNLTTVESNLTTVESSVAAIQDVIPSTPQDFGAVSGDSGDDTSAIQSMLSSVSSGELKIPAGTYQLTGDLTITDKSNNDGEGSFVIQAQGVIFEGSHKIIIDTSKRVVINGLDAQDCDLCLRGCWWSSFNDMRFTTLRMGDASSTNWNSNYWNSWNNCQMQNVVVGSSSNSASNAMTFNGCTFRGNNQQGWDSSKDYAFEFNANNQDCQNWTLNAGDVSYHNTAIYTIDSSNTSGDVELTFNEVYFDTLTPAKTERAKTRIVTNNCHHANFDAYGETVQSSLVGGFDSYNTSRSAKVLPTVYQNLVPNGDLRERTSDWTDAKQPLDNDGGATVTTQDGGFSGTYLNVNSSTGSTVWLNKDAFPETSIATYSIVVRNANVGDVDLRFRLDGIYATKTISDSGWNLVTLTTGTAIAAGATPALSFFSPTSSAFNIDIAYIGLNLGEGGALLPPCPPKPHIYSRQGFNIPSLADGGFYLKTWTVDGAELGDWVSVAPEGEIQGLSLTPYVKQAGVVAMSVVNNTGSTQDVPNMFWKIKIEKH